VDARCGSCRSWYGGSCRYHAKEGKWIAADANNAIYALDRTNINLFPFSQRNAAQEDLGSGHSLSGSVNNRAALLLGGGAAAATGAAAALPKFLSVPSMRRTPSGIEVASNGAVLEQSPSNYYEMEGAVDASELPEGVDISPNGTLTPYMV
jgi:hypothetical protein